LSDRQKEFDIIDKSLSSGVARFSGGTMISRILGLVREQVFAVLFGAGIYTDAFFAAFRIPNFLRDLLAEGVFSAAFIPTFSEEKSKKGLRSAFQLANLAFTSMAIITSLICLIGIILTPYIVSVLTPGFSGTDGQMQLTVLLGRIMFPLLMFMSLASVAMGILNSFGLFGIPALAPTMFNIAMIGCGLLLRKYFDPPIISMAIGVFIGGAGQLSFHLPALFRIGFRFRPIINFSDPRIIKIFSLMLPASIGTAAIQINIFIATVLASMLPEGSLSYLNYGYRLMHLPLALFGVAVASVSLPRFSIKSYNNDIEGLRDEYFSSLRLSLFLMLPATFFILAAAYPIVGTIFQHGRFHYEDTVATVNVLRIYAVGLFAFSTVRITSQVFFSMKDTKTPMKVGVLAVAVNIILNLVLIKPFQFLGLAAATTISGIINMTILIILLHRSVRNLEIQKLAGFLFKIVITNLLIASAAAFICIKMGLNKISAGGLERGIMLLVLLSGYIIIYMAISWTFRIDEVHKIIGLFRRGKN
jgi:putative peptidoglycan lipid II flippase